MRAKDQRGPYIKALTEGSGEHSYLTATDADEGRRYVWKVVDDRGELVAIAHDEGPLLGRMGR